MDYGKFPKHRGFGPGSAAGEKKARFLDTVDAPFLHHTAPDGTTARKSGFGQLSVTPGDPVEELVDGYYSVGQVVSGGTRIVGSWSGYGAFLPRGSAPSAGGFTVSQLGYYGRGYGVVRSAGDTVDVLDFMDRPVKLRTSVWHRTRYGRKLEEYGRAYWVTPTQMPLIHSKPTATGLPGGYRPTDDGPRFVHAQAGVVLDEDGQYRVALVRDDGAGSLEEFIGPGVPNEMMWYCEPEIVSPGMVLMIARLPRALYPAGASTASPGLKAYCTPDAGESWVEVPTSIWAPEMSQMMGLSAAEGGMFNEALGYSTFYACALSAAKSVVVVSAPYVQYSGLGYTYNARVKLGLFDHVTHTLTEQQQLYEGFAGPASWYVRQLVPCRTGALLLTYQVEQTAFRELPARVRHIDRQGAVTEVGFMPRPAYQTGWIGSLDEAHLCCPMYDGQHSLYVSRDGAQTWSRRATLSANAPVPGATAKEAGRLVDFGVLTGLRRNGRPLPAFPIAPWITDCRVSPP